MRDQLRWNWLYQCWCKSSSLSWKKSRRRTHLWNLILKTISSWSSSRTLIHIQRVLMKASIENSKISVTQFTESLNHWDTGQWNINLCWTHSSKKDSWWLTWSRMPTLKLKKSEASNLSKKKDSNFSKLNSEELRKWSCNSRESEAETHSKSTHWLMEFWANSLMLNQARDSSPPWSKDHSPWEIYKLLMTESKAWSDKKMPKSTYSETKLQRSKPPDLFQLSIKAKIKWSEFFKVKTSNLRTRLTTWEAQRDQKNWSDNTENKWESTRSEFSLLKTRNQSWLPSFRTSKENTKSRCNCQSISLMLPSRVSRRSSICLLQSIHTTLWTAQSKRSQWSNHKLKTSQKLRVDQWSRTTGPAPTDQRFQTQGSAPHTDHLQKVNQFHHQWEKDSPQLPNMELPAWPIQACWVPKMLKAQFTTQDTTWLQASKEVLSINTKEHIKIVDWTDTSQALTNQAAVHHCNRDLIRHQQPRTRQQLVETQLSKLEPISQALTKLQTHQLSSHHHTNPKEPTSHTNPPAEYTDHRLSSREPASCQSQLTRSEPNE